MPELDPDIFPIHRPPQYGVYLRWPQDGIAWIHPDDVDQVADVIPSYRIFRREDLDPDYVVLTYADLRLRVRPTMWIEIPTDGYEVGDQVEIKSKLGQREAAIATIREMLWNPMTSSIDYYLFAGEREMRSLA